MLATIKRESTLDRAGKRARYVLYWGALCALAVLVQLSRLAAAEKWPAEHTAGPFLCHADFSLDSQQGPLAEMESLQRDVAVILGTQEPRESIHLFLFEKQATYEAYLKRYFPRVPSRRALYIKGRGPGMVFAHQGTDFEIDVRHESTHALLHASFETVPLWLDEGIAEYFEVPKGKRASENPHLTTIRALLRQGTSPRLEALEEISDLKNMGRDEYRDAWAWVHFMIHGPREAHAELISYLEEAQSGGEKEKLSARLRRRVPDLERRMAEHFKP